MYEERGRGDLNNRLQRKTRAGSNPSITNFTYDRNGNQLTQNTNGDTKTLTYDFFNHLVEVERDGMIAEYTYRADGLDKQLRMYGIRYT